MLPGSYTGHSGGHSAHSDGAPPGGPGPSPVLGPAHRRALPAGRVVVGGFLVAVAAVVVFAAALSPSSSRGQPWLVATRSLRPGTILAPGDLATATMRLPHGTAGLAFSQISALEGRALAVPVSPGELVQSPMLVPADQTPALRPVSVAVNPVSLANLTPGELVDVLATQGSGSGATVTIVARGATLIDVVTSGSELLAPGGSGQVTLGVESLAEAEAVLQASQAGTVSLVAAEPSDGVGLGSGTGGS
jgi:Flp pilus assembly protein CpaB